MVPKNKDGRTVYPAVFEVMRRIGDDLEEIGFRESSNKPNLFYKPLMVMYSAGPDILEFADFVAYADMRGTNIIPIWEDPVPLVYVKDVKESCQEWLYRKANCQTYKMLREHGIPFRISGELLVEGDSPENPDGGPNGFCFLCGKEMYVGASFCDSQCESWCVSEVPVRFRL
jgi:hypothetical protein